MPGTRRDRRHSGRRRQPEEDAPSELPVDVPPTSLPEADPPVDSIPEPDPPIEDPVEDEAPENDPEPVDEDPAPEALVEIPGPVEVPESVMEAIADNISEAVPESVEEEVPQQEPEDLPTEEISDIEAMADVAPVDPEYDPDLEAVAEDVNGEAETEMDAEIGEELDNVLNDGETIAAVSPLVEAGKLADYLRQKITDLRAIVVSLEEENANLTAERNARPEFDEYVLTGDCRIVFDVSDLQILVPKDSTVELKKEE